MANSLHLFGLPGVPLVKPGDSIPKLIFDSVKKLGDQLNDNDIVVIAQKVISKSEDRFVALETVAPSEYATKLGGQTDKDPRLVELVLSESKEVLRYRKGVLIVVHRLGFVLANAGIDRSNVGPKRGQEWVLLLPKDPNGSCAQIREELRALSGATVAVVINDSFGRAWRNGTTGIAIGSAGLQALVDQRGKRDLFGRPLEATQIGVADEVASAASLLQGQADEGTPFVILRGVRYPEAEDDASILIRKPEEDLFR